MNPNAAIGDERVLSYIFSLFSTQSGIAHRRVACPGKGSALSSLTQLQIAIGPGDDEKAAAALMIGGRLTMKKFLITTLMFCFFPFFAFAESSAITIDPPADKTNPASMEGFTLPSHGSQINVLAYVASGAGPHPVVVMLHGFPGNERNIDVAQAMRRAGYTVLVSSYRGASNSQGAFSFTHALEDSQAAVDYLRVPANAKRLRADPDKIVLLGHSMGGWMALATGAADTKVRAVITISAAEMPALVEAAVTKYGAAKAIEGCVPSMNDGAFASLAGDTPEAACREIIGHARKWTFSNDVEELATRPVFLITSDDGYEASAEAFAKALRAAGNKQVHEAHLATDHSYSDKRIALTQIVLDDLDMLKLQ
jgi:acetyl esterase/lipase